MNKITFNFTTAGKVHAELNEWIELMQNEIVPDSIEITDTIENDWTDEAGKLFLNKIRSIEKDEEHLGSLLDQSKQRIIEAIQKAEETEEKVISEI